MTLWASKSCRSSLGEDEARFVGAQVAVAPVQAVQADGQRQDSEQRDGDERTQASGQAERHLHDDAAEAVAGATRATAIRSRVPCNRSVKKLRAANPTEKSTKNMPIDGA